MVEEKWEFSKYKKVFFGVIMRYFQGYMAFYLLAMEVFMVKTR